MKILKNTLILPCLLFCAIWVIAQTYPSQSSGQSSSQASNNETTVQGCLSGGPSGNYTITDSSGTTYLLAGDTSKLSEHVGHKVEIRGTASSASTNSSGSSKTPSSTGMSNQPTLNVSSIKHISKTCQ